MNEEQTDCKIPLFQPNDHRVTVGRYSYGSPLLLIWADHERIEIGSFCSIAANVTIFAGGEHNLNWVTTYPLRIAFDDPLAELDGHPKTKGKTIIENDVWIGFGATILSGVTIGNGAVVGAGSVVVKDVPPYAIVAGNPAKLIRYRFNKKTISKLLEIAWWDWPIQEIKSHTASLCGEDSFDFICKNPAKKPYSTTKTTASLFSKIFAPFRKN